MKIEIESVNRVASSLKIDGADLSPSIRNAVLHIRGGGTRQLVLDLGADVEVVVNSWPDPSFDPSRAAGEFAKVEAQKAEDQAASATMESAK